MITLELFGVARARAGVAELTVSAATLRDALAAARRQCPGLAGLIDANGRPSPHLLVSLNGERFVMDLDAPLEDGSRVLVLPADAGG